MTDLKMTERHGFNGKLNDAILTRIRFLSEQLNLPNLDEKFPHLKVTDGSWRAQLPGDDVNLADYIDHTLLKPEGTRAAHVQLCEEAMKHKFYAVCVNGSHVKLCVDLLRGSQVRVGACVGFPLGACSTAAKAAETSDEVANGARDVDMVLHIGAVKDKNYRYVYEDIKAVVDAAGEGITTKVIFETCLLTKEEIMDCCIISVAAGASFVKTSTGFSTGGATPEDIDMMLAVVGNQAKVKASGGVRDRSTALQYVKVGVSRIGTSSGVVIVDSGSNS